MANNRFSSTNNPMNNPVTATKNALSRKMTESLFEGDGKYSFKNKLIKASTMDYILKRMYTEHGKDNASWIKEFIDSQLVMAVKDPESKAAERFAKGLFNESLVDQIEIYLNKANKDDIEYEIYKVRSTLYDRQMEVFDNNIDRNILIINSRRSGKTELMGRLIVKDLLQTPDSHVVYINRNSSAAIRQIKRPFETALARTDLTITKGSVENQLVTLSNGSQLLIIGNNNSADIDKLRGERISLCIMDECGHQRNTRQLIREVIKPALMDYNNSKLILVGTPPRIPRTYVEDCWNNPNWKKYSWTFMSNPFIPNRDSVIDEVCKENGCDPNSAFIQREYFGRMDAYDDDAKWIKKYSTVTSEQLRATTVWDYCWICVDWGYEDLGAIITVLASSKQKRAYVVESWSKGHTGIAEKAEEIQRQISLAKTNYNLAREPIVICDTNNKEAISDLYHVYHIKNVFGAYKYDKDMAMDQLNDFFGSNKITLLEGHCEPLITDIENSLWKRDEETDKILHEIDDDIWHPNALMALLYGSRQFAIDVLNYIEANKPAKEFHKTEDLLDDSGHVIPEMLDDYFSKKRTKYNETDGK